MQTDASIDVGKMIIVASFEVQCAIVASNLPATKALWTKVRGKYSSSESSDPSPQKPYKLSIIGRGRRGELERHRSMGSITRLERDIENESQEMLFEEADGNQETRFVEGKKSHQRSIVVTTHVDVEHSPRL
jgi:hypothetical protein